MAPQTTTATPTTGVPRRRWHKPIYNHNLFVKCSSAFVFRAQLLHVSGDVGKQLGADATGKGVHVVVAGGGGGGGAVPDEVAAAGGLEGERSSGGDLRVAPERVTGGGEASSAADRGGGGVDRAPVGARGGAGGVRGACGEGGGGAGQDDWVHVEEDRGGGIGWEGTLREEESGVVGSTRSLKEEVEVIFCPSFKAQHLPQHKTCDVTLNQKKGGVFAQGCSCWRGTLQSWCRRGWWPPV
ncbi:hypothetical protein DEO72_LG8g909 [Vigna unguiculata]|uniref:Uncharacterized protein n=1 Tax=Vigna unguiculata TaxID=3917 RepID=A0A4D6MNF5_VIGUN|nr:hypothetical protein DEO72_LG8g909 [Vigna unguiculata]